MELTTGMAVAAGAVGALLVAGAIAWAMYGRRTRATVGTPEAALATTEATLPGFTAVAVVVGADGRAALVSGENGRLAVLTARRDRVFAHEIGWPAVRATAAGIVVEVGKRPDTVAIAGVDALDVRRLAPA